jgi:hypothetical protein
MSMLVDDLATGTASVDPDDIARRVLLSTEEVRIELQSDGDLCQSDIGRANRTCIRCPFQSLSMQSF